MSAIGGYRYVPHWKAPCHSMSTVWRLTAKMCVLGWIVKCFLTFGCPRLEALTGRGGFTCMCNILGGVVPIVMQLLVYLYIAIQCIRPCRKDICVSNVRHMYVTCMQFMYQWVNVCVILDGVVPIVITLLVCISTSVFSVF